MPWGLLAAGIASTASMAYDQFKRQQNLKDQKKQMLEKNKLDVENWRRQNVYNSPQQQMARLHSAGLSPNMVYQSGGSTVGSGEIPSSEYGTGFKDYSDFTGGSVNAYQAVESLRQNRDAVESQVALNKAQQDLTNTRGYNEFIDSMEKEAKLPYRFQRAAQEYRELYQGNEKVQREIDNLESQKQLILTQTGLTNQQLIEAQESWPERKKQISQTLDNLKDQHYLNKATYDEIQRRISNMETQDLMYMYEIDGIKIENMIKEIQASNSQAEIDRILEKYDKEIALLRRQFKWLPVNSVWQNTNQSINTIGNVISNLKK